MGATSPIKGRLMVDTFPNPSVFQSTVTFEDAVTFEAETTFQDTMTLPVLNGQAKNAMNLQYEGTAHAVIFNRVAGNPSNGNVLLVTAGDLGTDANAMDTTVGISGYETGKGTLKVSHNKPVAAVTVTDGNASVLSLRCNGSGTAAQGIFFDAPQTGGTTGKLLNFRQDGVEKFVVNKDGRIEISHQGSGGGIICGGDAKFYRSAANTWAVSDHLEPAAANGMKICTSTSQKLGFWNATPVVKPTVTGSRGGNAALQSLLTQLATIGLLTDSSS